MEYYIITYENQDGENRYSSYILLSCENGEKDKKIHNYFKDFFGEGTTFRDGWYQGFERALRVSATQEIPKGDYEILRKYLYEI